MSMSQLEKKLDDAVKNLDEAAKALNSRGPINSGSNPLIPEEQCALQAAYVAAKNTVCGAKRALAAAAVPSEAQIKAASALDSALREQSSDSTEAAVGDAFRAGLHPIHCPSLIRLVESPWHYRHEDIVHALQEIGRPDAVSALERTAFSSYKYRAYDEYGMLASQCAWALADIGTLEAHEALMRIAACGNEVIARSARERLENWERELPRKRCQTSTD